MHSAGYKLQNFGGKARQMTSDGFMMLRKKTYGDYVDKMNKRVKQPQPTMKESLKGFIRRFKK